MNSPTQTLDAQIAEYRKQCATTLRKRQKNQVVKRGTDYAPNVAPTPERHIYAQR